MRLSDRNLTRWLFGLGGPVVLAGALTIGLRDGDESAPRPVSAPVRAAKPEGALLYCEFYNFVGRAPKVGFTFAMEPRGPDPIFRQTGQIEADGTHTTFGEAGAAPVWPYEAVESPAVLTSPDGAIRINLYGYDPARRGTTWFEAGLRSVQYLNLDGKCRQSGA